MSDIWTWNGSDWTQQYPATVPALSTTFQGQQVMFDYPDMVYDPTTGKLLLPLFFSLIRGIYISKRPAIHQTAGLLNSIAVVTLSSFVTPFYRHI